MSQEIKIEVKTKITMHVADGLEKDKLREIVEAVVTSFNASIEHGSETTFDEMYTTDYEVWNNEETLIPLTDFE